MIKVAHLLPSSVIFPLTVHNGRYQWVYDLAKRQVESGIDVTIYCNRNSISDNPGIKFAYLPSESTDKQLNNLALINQAFADTSFDIYHSHFDYLHYVLATRTTKPILYTMHWKLTAETKFIAANFNAANVTAIPVTKFQQELNHQNGIQTTTNIYHGIDLNEFKYNPHPSSDRFIFVGRIAQHKGVKEVVELIAKTDYKLDIIGKISESDRAYWETFKDQVDGDKIRYLGPQEHSAIPQYFANALAFIFPVQSEEAFGLVTVEAMATGTPVISLNVGPMSELIIDGETGYLASDLNSMRECLSKVDLIKRSDCRKQAEKFSIDEMVRKYNALYESYS